MLKITITNDDGSTIENIINRPYNKYNNGTQYLLGEYSIVIYQNKEITETNRKSIKIERVETKK